MVALVVPAWMSFVRPRGWTSPGAVLSSVKTDGAIGLAEGDPIE